MNLKTKTVHKHQGHTFDRQFESGAWYAMIKLPWKIAGGEVKFLLSCECPKCQKKGKEK